MEYLGRVQNGVIVVDNNVCLPEGAFVRVVVLDEAEETPSLADIFQDVAGKAVSLPEDMAEIHDHYLHGLPKRDPA
jgi:hypothetical protein